MIHGVFVGPEAGEFVGLLEVLLSISYGTVESSTCKYGEQQSPPFWRLAIERSFSVDSLILLGKGGPMKDR